MAPVRKRGGNAVIKENLVKEPSSPQKRRKKLETCKESTLKVENTKKCSNSSKKTNGTKTDSTPAKIRKSNKCTAEKKLKNKEQKEESLVVEDVNNMNVAQLLAMGEKFEELENKNDENLSFVDSESERSDFEEVTDVVKTEPDIPKDGVNITLEVPNMHVRHKKKGFDLEGHLKRQLNRVKKDLQLLMHKVHVLCWIAHLRFVNNTLNTPLLMEECMKLVKSKNLYPSKYSDLTYLEGILKWFHKTIEYKKDCEEPECKGGLLLELKYQLEKKQAFSSKSFIFIFIILLRVLGLKSRIIMSFQVLPVRPPTSELYDSKHFKDIKKNENGEQNPSCSKNVEEAESENKSQGEEKKKEKLTPKRKSSSDGSESKAKKKSKKNKEDEDENSDDDFESVHFKPVGPKKGRNVQKKTKVEKSEDVKAKVKGSNKSSKTEKKPSIQKYENSDEEDDEFKPKSLQRKSVKKKEEKKQTGIEEIKKREGSDIWTEVYLEAEEKWISVDVVRQKIHCVNELHSRATHPVVYIIACNNDHTLKDVTKRYVPNWHSDTRKRRVDEVWWDETIKPYLPPRNARDREEDEDINRQLTDKPLPTVISEYKDHPLYALKRHLLKFEGIYPPDAPTLGFVRGEPVYARECVHVLRSREIWYKEARVVRLKEEPYKIVKARPKFDKMTGEIKKDLPLELFGMWQTEPYIPPIAVDGKVPRNEYGNVDLFKPCMLPIGTVHLQIPALNRVAKKLGIDCAPATVGFDFHSGGSHPIFDGFVVCEEFKQILLDTWDKEMDESAKRSEERKEKRVYGNWKRLIRGLLIREKLKIKYAFGENCDDEGSSSTKPTNSSQSNS